MFVAYNINSLWEDKPQLSKKSANAKPKALEMISITELIPLEGVISKNSFPFLKKRSISLNKLLLMNCQNSWTKVISPPTKPFLRLSKEQQPLELEITMSWTKCSRKLSPRPKNVTVSGNRILRKSVGGTEIAKKIHSLLFSEYQLVLRTIYYIPEK